MLEDFLPQAEKSDEAAQPAMTSLPLGLKLSNHLPDIKINNYNISFIDAVTDKSYSISGDTFSVKDFILDKKIKVYTTGQMMLDDRVQFNYDVRVFNKIMPDLILNDLVFSAPEQNSPQTQKYLSKSTECKCNCRFKNNWIF